jgi:hypothetical protein
MQEDRSEIRMNKNILLSSTYFVISGIIAITAFSIGRDDENLKNALLFGMWSLLFLYILYFAYFVYHLKILRLYLDIRERYYKDLVYLYAEEPFKPLKPADPNAKPSLKHNFLWFLPLITLLVSSVNTYLIGIG